MSKVTLAMLCLMLALSSCASPNATTPATTAPTQAVVAEPAYVVPDLSHDREGNPITLPAQRERIITMGPSNTEILVALGFAAQIVAIDDYSTDVAGIAADLPQFVMSAPDGEQIIELEPDIIFATGMSRVSGSDPYETIRNSGVCVIYIPSSDSIRGIKEDIIFIAAVMGAQAKAEQLLKDMDAEISAICASVADLAGQYSAYFEISAAPYMYSFGKGVFLHEMLELLGMENILADQESWQPVGDEAVIQANPDFIFTNVNYLPDPVAEIKDRPGWDSIAAVQNDMVFFIDTNASSRPSHNITVALSEMADALSSKR